MANTKSYLRALTALGLLLCVSSANGQATATPATSTKKCEVTTAPCTEVPSPADPYPLNAAGWGPEVGNGLLASRWAEDWTGMRSVGKAPVLKGIALGDAASLTFSAETRLRYDFYDNGQLARDRDYEQGLFRGIVGADLRLHPALRVYSEIGTGQVSSRRDEAGANFKNDASLQQLFGEAKAYFGENLTGVLFGRQEFSDGPRQLISLSDGPNIHRTWNGMRFYSHWPSFRVGAFNFRATRQDRGAFDETINRGERLYGANASLVISPTGVPNIYLDPFWFHTENDAFRSGSQTGGDRRNTFGARLWGRRHGLRFDWTLERQVGTFRERRSDAWGLFTVQSIALSERGWKARLTARVDIASGGGTYQGGTLRAFNQLYASSNYLGEGQFLSLSNLVMIAPGFSISPAPRTNLAIEYGFARRLKETDAAYAGGMRPYAGTQNVPGRDVGNLLRAMGSWAASKHLTLFLNYEHFSAGEVLKRVARPSGSYAYIGATWRY